MGFLPEIRFTLFNGFLMIGMMLFIRIAYVKIKYPKTENKLDYFPPVKGIEKASLLGYFIFNTLLVFSPIICKIQYLSILYLILTIILYVIGIIFLILSVKSFSQDNDLTTKGIYKYSRNPMYIGYLLIYISVGLAINSILYLLIVAIYQLCVHFLILSEERWCKETFKGAYIAYVKQTRRYL